MDPYIQESLSTGPLDQLFTIIYDPPVRGNNWLTPFLEWVMNGSPRNSLESLDLAISTQEER